MYFFFKKMEQPILWIDLHIAWFGNGATIEKGIRKMTNYKQTD